MADGKKTTAYLGSRITAANVLLTDEALDARMILTFIGLSRDREFRADFERFLAEMHDHQQAEFCPLAKRPASP